jgi:hypothetical protein
MIDTDDQLGKDSITVRLITLILDMPYDRQLALLKQLEEIPMTTFDVSDRDDPRKSYSSMVSFTAKDRTYKGASKDLSSGGMFIETNESFSVGEIITVTIPFADKKRNIKVPAEIMRITDEGIGVKFIKK